MHQVNYNNGDSFSLSLGSPKRSGFSMEIVIDANRPQVYLLVWPDWYSGKSPVRISLGTFENPGIADDFIALASFITKHVGKPRITEAQPEADAPQAPARSNGAPAHEPPQDIEQVLVAAADRGWDESGDEWICGGCARSVFCDGFPKGWIEDHENGHPVCNECQFIAKRTKKP